MDVVRTATYSLQNTHPKEMAATVAIYRDAVEELAIIVRAEWARISLCGDLDKKEHLVEDFVITTAPRKKREPKGVPAPAVHPPSDPASDPVVMTTGNKADYPDFEKSFGNMPAYLRRAAIRDAIGLVASHNTRFDQWNDKRAGIVTSKKTDRQKKTALVKLGKPPTFQPKTMKTPAMYRGSKRKIQKAVGVGRTLKKKIAGVRTDAGGVLVWTSAEHAALKLYNGTTWGWYCVKIKVPKKDKFPETDGWVEGTPALVPTRGTFEIHISMEKKVLLNVKGTGKPVLSVDLGLNTRATAAIVNPNGTILNREFINCSQNTGSLEHLLGKIAQGYKLSGQPAEGRRSCRSLWRQVAFLTDEIAHSVSAELVRIAKEHDCEAIVFEYLGKMQVPRDFYGAKRLRKKLHYWMQGRIQRYTKQKAHAAGVRFSRVLARGTSAEAFDGSGPVKRTGSCKIARFQNGSTYDADLSAAYNIAARYWIRELHEKFPKAKAVQALDGAMVVTAVDQSPETRRKTKATRENAVVAGQGTTCPVAGPDVKQKLFVTGVPVARHQQTLASLISLNDWVGAQRANTLRDRTHATVKALPLIGVSL